MFIRNPSRLLKPSRYHPCSHRRVLSSRSWRRVGWRRCLIAGVRGRGLRGVAAPEEIGTAASRAGKIEGCEALRSSRNLIRNTTRWKQDQNPAHHTPTSQLNKDNTAVGCALERQEMAATERKGKGARSFVSPTAALWTGWLSYLSCLRQVGSSSISVWRLYPFNKALNTPRAGCTCTTHTAPRPTLSTPSHERVTPRES